MGSVKGHRKQNPAPLSSLGLHIQKLGVQGMGMLLGPQRLHKHKDPTKHDFWYPSSTDCAFRVLVLLCQRMHKEKGTECIARPLNKLGNARLQRTGGDTVCPALTRCRNELQHMLLCMTHNGPLHVISTAGFCAGALRVQESLQRGLLGPWFRTVISS